MIPFLTPDAKKYAKSDPKNSGGVHLPFAAMSCEVKLKTLQGGVITLDIPITASVRELKTMLLAKHPCQHPLLKVELLRDSSIIDDDDETLDSAGFFCTESLVTVAYTRNEVEAATKDDIDDLCNQRCFGVKIPCNLTEISRAAFSNCSQLVSVTMGNAVTHILDRAFAECTSLTNIIMGESVTHIGREAFACCDSLRSITIGKSVTHIGHAAFRRCTSLRSVTIGESVTHLGEGAFSCTSLTSITIGESVTHIGVEAFAYCYSLRSITIGESVTHIGGGAFLHCDSLRSVTIGESVTHIHGAAFSGCDFLTEVIVPGSSGHTLEWWKEYLGSGSKSLKIITSAQGRKRLRSE